LKGMPFINKKLKTLNLQRADIERAPEIETQSKS